MSVGDMGSFGLRMILVTSHVDLAISRASQGQYVNALGTRWMGCPSSSTIPIRLDRATTPRTEIMPAGTVITV